ncbi:hypothetical protein [Humidisolicoccus flavus]|uniref:hypothetical protein n=1 Tax=Humidisolicoccus flavus TaxID=3111414 RepID=UPI003246C15D
MTPAPGVSKTSHSGQANAAKPTPKPYQYWLECAKPDGVQVCAPSNDQTSAPAARPDDGTVTYRTITSTDLQRFVPADTEFITEPAHFAVLNTPTNAYTTASQHTVEGIIFDTPLTVRWTPELYAFDYGDGTTIESSTPGTAWTTPWKNTETSHAYEGTGTFTLALTVMWSAEVQFDGTDVWVAIPGTVQSTTPGPTLQVYRASTVLTNGDCTNQPTQPGCK